MWYRGAVHIGLIATTAPKGARCRITLSAFFFDVFCFFSSSSSSLVTLVN